MKKITVSAPGKLMLLGEHAVVHNHHCLVTAVNKRMKLSLEENAKSSLIVQANEVGIDHYEKNIQTVGKGDIPKQVAFIEQAFNLFIETYKVEKGVKITTHPEFSSKFGFGSSSAVTVCVLKALTEFHSINIDNRTLFDLAYKVVLKVQGKGSGFDIAAAVYGGTLLFYTAGKIIEPILSDPLPLVVGYSGIKADTVTLIKKVSALSNQYSDVVESTYESIDKLVMQAKDALIKNDWSTFGQLMNMNQGYLELLGVSTGKLSSLIYAAREAGAIGAKLSGAGGGDCMIAIGSVQTLKNINTAITNAGGEVIPVEASAPGVTIE